MASGGEPHTYKISFPNNRGAMDFPVDGVSGTGGDTDSDASTLFTPAYPGYRDYTVGG